MNTLLSDRAQAIVDQHRDRFDPNNPAHWALLKATISIELYKVEMEARTAALREIRQAIKHEQLNNGS